MTQEVSKTGIKETKEALIGVLEFSLLVAEHLKDGAQLEDVTAVWVDLQKDDDLKMKLNAAWEGVKLIDEEVGDIDLSEGLEVLLAVVPYVPKFLEALKK